MVTQWAILNAKGELVTKLKPGGTEPKDLEPGYVAVDAATLAPDVKREEVEVKPETVKEVQADADSRIEKLTEQVNALAEQLAQQAASSSELVARVEVLEKSK